MPVLAPAHLEDLRNSGLTDGTIDMMAAASVLPAELDQLRLPSNVESALRFPYFTDDGFFRLKLFPRGTLKDGKKMRYWQPPDSGTPLYILPRVRAVLSDPTVPLLIIEGEKKTAC